MLHLCVARIAVVLLLQHRHVTANMPKQAVTTHAQTVAASCPFSFWAVIYRESLLECTVALKEGQVDLQSMTTRAQQHVGGTFRTLLPDSQQSKHIDSLNPWAPVMAGLPTQKHSAWLASTQRASRPTCGEISG